MDELYGEVLALRALLRAAGREAEAADLLRALTDGCNARELLDGLRVALAEFPPDAELGGEMAASKTRLLALLEAEWDRLGA